MRNKILLLSLVLIFLLTGSKPMQTCPVHASGKIQAVYTGTPTRVAELFDKPFCRVPVITTGWGENVTQVNVGVVTTVRVDFLIEATVPKETEVILYWHAEPPTQ